ncbi:four-helix bundle copper-binding protein [Paenibacillus hunanensis]|uniref:four-helix bundle copper-binding protein n=1 Tax=Paenibacillus hunanensis TaxID=539262 RepID=UPI002026C21B|nr:four-helix bundle copper-binding protein [Paenibacillus hunanensis]MCL9660109.1 four-helix bundle copper-binding protein [Paenibacillus hunanensis]WPP39759.1 four-helix bundle copper-binding protein [Paenibacillus hunanensis]
MSTPHQYRPYIEACVEAMNACNLSYVSNLKQYDLEKLCDCIRVNRDCAEVCSFTIQALSQGNAFAAEIAGLCAKACEACIAECSKHEQTHCQDCVEACRRCAEMCRELEGSLALV